MCGGGQIVYRGMQRTVWRHAEACRGAKRVTEVCGGAWEVCGGCGKV